jgi:Periplasmic glucans biosynthesis protein
MHTGAGEWIWRPLDNPETLRVYSFLDDNPKGFGLEQRDRRFADYEDDGAWYNLRPSLWVEPLEGWGKGAVQLVEIPTRDETFDNIVAFWNPQRKTAAGQTWQLGYRLWWGSYPPAHSPLARVSSTRTGAGGVLGQKNKQYSRRFVVDFRGNGIDKIPADSGVEPVITVSRGKILRPSARPLLDAPGHAVGYRVMFDLDPQGPSTDPIDLRLFLRRNGQPLSETWMYEWAPPPLQQRNP